MGRELTRNEKCGRGFSVMSLGLELSRLGVHLGGAGLGLGVRVQPGVGWGKISGLGLLR